MENTPPTSSNAPGRADDSMHLDSDTELDGNEAPNRSLVDPARPFLGVVVCCTSVPPVQRKKLEQTIGELGGVHTCDLTPDVTHLIVGDYETAKYRHVARDRMDVLPMAAGWVSAVKALWMEGDKSIDFDALEREWRLKAFERRGRCEGPEPSDANPRQLLCCLTGFNDIEERKKLVEKIEANGGAYTGDLTRRVTHLVVANPEGLKYNHARKWGLKTVSIEWLEDSAARGMILEEALYDPTLPVSERGKGAWTHRWARRISHTKRLRDAVAAAEGQGRRKLRKTASMKMMSQTGELWDDILRNKQSASVDTSGDASAQPSTQPPAQPSVGSDVPTQPPHSSSLLHNGGRLQQPGMQSFTPDRPVFASCFFFLYGFSQTRTDVLANAVSSLGGHICSTLDDLVSGVDATHRFLIVPQSSKAETHPQVPEDVQVVTEFYVEKCLHRKRFYPPGEHVLGRPFPSFPIAGFQRLAISTAGFTDIDLNHVDKAVRQLGARYEERFAPQISVLVCSSSLDTVRKQKLELALAWNVPVVKADWLWECISTGFNVPPAPYMFPELKQVLPESKDERLGEKKVMPSAPSSLEISADLAQPPRPSRDSSSRTAKALAKSRIREIDMEAFSKDEDKKEPKRSRSPEHDCNLNDTEDFDTAPTHQDPPVDESPAPLSVTSPNQLNKAQLNKAPRPSQDSEKREKTPRQPLARVRSEVADSEAESEAPSEHEGVARPLAIPEEEHAQEGEQPPAPIVDETDTRRQRHENERNALATNLISMIVASGEGTAATSATACAPTREPRQLRHRARRPLGRAVSNSSTGSTGEPSRALIRSNSGGSATTVATVVSVDEPRAPPPPTQISFEDPDADVAKAALHRRIAGDPGRASAPPGPRRETKLSLGDVGGYAEENRAREGRAGGLGERRARKR